MEASLDVSIQFHQSSIPGISNFTLRCNAPVHAWIECAEEGNTLQGQQSFQNGDLLAIPLSCGLSSGRLTVTMLGTVIYITKMGEDKSNKVVRAATITVNGKDLHKPVWGNFSRSIVVREEKVEFQESKMSIENNWEYFIIGIILITILGVGGVTIYALWKCHLDRLQHDLAYREFEYRRQGSRWWHNQNQRFVAPLWCSFKLQYTRDYNLR
jgi:hypothetical protein